MTSGASKMDGRRSLLVVVGLLLLAVSTVAVLRWLQSPEAAVWQARRMASGDYQSRRAVPLAVRIRPGGRLADRWTPDRLRQRFGALAEHVARLPAPQLGLEIAELTFRTVDAEGMPRDVECLLLTPAGLRDARVTLYLPSSGAVRGTLLEAEAVTAALRFQPRRRVLVVPLPVREHRGQPWPPLFGGDLASFEVLARQTALDVRRAVDVAGDEGWKVDGLAGFSLGGCFAAALAGLHAGAFRGADLHIWAGGGDLALLRSISSHPLLRCLDRPAGMNERSYEQRLAALDPAAHLGHAHVRRVHLYLGRGDDIIPAESTAALQRACERAGLVVEVVAQRGGHVGALGPWEAWRSLIPSLGGW